MTDGKPTLLRMKDIVSRTGMSKPWIYAEMKNGRFPKSIPIGGASSTVVWIESEIEEWIREKILAARPDYAKTKRDEARH